MGGNSLAAEQKLAKTSLIVINDLDVTDTNFWKNVDDTTIIENVYKNVIRTIHSRKSTADEFRLNEDLCKALQAFSARPERSFTPIFVDINKLIDVVSNTKVLGMHILKDVK